ncbi:Nucleic-acid-binding protein transposon like protein [Argiope bruennichi]|uniref:Nucleic-acid-binding protein transposon like protein n=1 Tax=Argiope bruennichi TaxID=94029 RepID=A0A8T0FLW2_ARGBR|nr:Nucleic-acid-binding protein transposon like protein [Argiope bruennichi]
MASSNMDNTNTASDITNAGTLTTSAAEVSANPNNSDFGSFKINLNAFFNEIEYKFIMDKVKSILEFLHAIPNETFDTISEIALISSEALILSTSRVDHLTAQLVSHGSNLAENAPAQLGLNPELCHPVRHRKTEILMPLFLVTLPKNETGKAIFNLTTIRYLNVTLETLRRKQTPVQYYNCQEFIHHSSLCTRNPRCLKCGVSYSTNSCTKPKDTQAKFCLCGGPHPADYSECPKNPAMRKSFQATPKDGWNNATALITYPHSSSGIHPLPNECSII